MKKVYFSIDGEWFTNFIRTLYYADDKSYDYCKDRLLNSLCLAELNMTDSEKEELAKSILFGDKKLIGINDLELVDDSDFNIYNYSRFSEPKFDKNKKGIVGILTQEGLFVQCHFRQHADTIDEIGQDKANGSLAFWTDIFADEFHITKDWEKRHTTKYQRSWIEQHKEYLSEDQLKDVRRIYKIEDYHDKQKNN
jgi:hypothetical protein